MSASLSWPYPRPPRFGPRWQAHRSRSRTRSCNGRISRLRSGSRTSQAWSTTRSTGSTSVRTNSSIQSSSRWKSGSVSKSHAMAASVSGSAGQDGAGGDAGCAVDLAEGGGRVTGDLPGAGGPAQLQRVLVDLAQAAGADRLAVGQAAAVGVDRQPAADLRGALGQQGF